MRRVCLGLLLWLPIVSYASSLKDMERLCAFREQFSSGYLFTYLVRFRYTELDRSPVREGVSQGSFVVDVYRGNNGITRFVVSPASEKKKIIRTDIGRQITVDSDNHLISWEAWFGDKWCIYTDSSLLGTSSRWTGGIETAVIYPTSGKSLYYFTRFQHLIFPRDSIDMILLSNANILRFMDTKWGKMTEQSDRWVLQGGYEGRFAQCTISLSLRKSDCLPLEVVTLEREGRFRWLITHTQKLGDIEIPKRIAVEKRFANYMQLIDICILEAKPIKGEVAIELPIGLQIHDYRLISYQKMLSSNREWLRNEVISYRWQGKLFSLEEIKQLAYQQGNLIPPDAPRRRFSPLLFVPAVIFFALAGYLYLRNRRR